MTAAAGRIRLVVSDIDGTLVTSDKRLTDGTIRAAARLADAGVALSLVSSRPPAGFAMMREPLKITGVFGAFNGGALLKPDLGIIEQILVPADAARIALATFAELGVDAWLFTNDVWYVSNSDGAYVPKERRTIQAEPVLAATFEPYLDKVGKLVGSTGDADLLARCETLLQQRLGNRASAKRSQAYYLDVTPQIATKGYAVKRIASFLDIPLTQVAVIGDAANDMPMFAVAGMTIAMGNAIGDLKRIADFTTESNEDDGFAVAMERYVLPRARELESR